MYYWHYFKILYEVFVFNNHDCEDIYLLRILISISYSLPTFLLRKSYEAHTVIIHILKIRQIRLRGINICPWLGTLSGDIT